MQTKEEIKQSMRQIETDNLTLDYSKRSFERRRAKLSPTTKYDRTHAIKL